MWTFTLNPWIQFFRAGKKKNQNQNQNQNQKVLIATRLKKKGKKNLSCDRRPSHIRIYSIVSIENSRIPISFPILPLSLLPIPKVLPILTSSISADIFLHFCVGTAKQQESRARFMLAMENEDEEAASHNPISELNSNKALTILSTTSLGLGLSFLYARSPQSVKPISTAIKVSEAALKGSRSLTAISSPTDLLFFSQYLIKISFAASTRFNCSPALDIKKIKAYLGAVNLVRYVRFLPVVGIGVFDLGVLKVGYKLSKNFMKVLEGFLGVQLDSAVRNCMEVVELFVKTATVTREVSRIADSTGLKERLKLGVVDGGCSENSSCTFVRNLDFDCGVCLDVERVEFGGRHSPSFGDCRYSSLGIGLLEGDLIRAPSSETCLSDLFCLSIPVHIEIVKHHL